MGSDKKTSLAVILAVLGVVLFSAKAVMVKLAYQFDIEAVPLLLLRMAFSIPVYAVMVFIKKPNNPESIEKKDYLWLVLFGFLGYYLASYFDFLGLAYIKASLERIILFVYPTLVLLISWVFLKKPVTKIQIFAILITYLGIIITFSDELKTTGDDVILGGVLIFFSALTYASYLVGSGWLIPKFGATTFTSYAMIVSCLAVIIHFYLFEKVDLLHFPNEVYYLGIAMAILSTVIPSYLVSAAIKQLGASNFSIIGSLGPISTILLANIFLDERITITQIIGTIVVIAGVFVVSKKK
ncbi:DMT family transporter [Reichenbachiella sp. MALMAid0571]|uniref:DMT family transporter n=1 Tax=Reichenbachiella sp. MALMAid0571 TaxID=3143939 RepID=UPI0032DFBADD